MKSHVANASKEFEAILEALKNALDEDDRERCRALVASAVRRTEKLSEVIAARPVKLGRQGGLKTAERGPEYFKKIAAMRKTRSGGRPRKSP